MGELLLSDVFEGWVARSPEAVAVVAGGESLTYRELDGRANALAFELIGCGVGPDVVVAVAAGRSVDLVVGLLAVVKAGGAYLPVDPRYSGARLEYVLADAGPLVVVTDRVTDGVLPAVGVPRVYLDDERSVVERAPSDADRVGSLCPDHLAYVIYTSGSTGVPKGVQVSLRSVWSLFAGMGSGVRGSGRGCVGVVSFAGVRFLGVGDVGCVAAWGTTVLVPWEVVRSPVDLWGVLVERGVTVLSQTPAAFYALIDARPREAVGSVLRLVVLGGEAVDPARVQGWWGRGWMRRRWSTCMGSLRRRCM
ncbi:AMP-binding protein [Streptomyces sp. DHE7-1]|nr:AMP-binding protein [Streptomyces sp. DHE7-1]